MKALIIIIIKSLFQEGNTISTELISLVALKYLQIIVQIVQINNDMYDSHRCDDITDSQAH